MEPIPQATEDIAKTGCGRRISSAFRTRPGLLESVYETCLCHELSRRKVSFLRQHSLPVVYDGVRLDSGLQPDLLVANCVIVEIKAVEKIHPVHQAQLLTYLKLAGMRLGFLINFNSVLIRDGIRRMVK